MLNNRLDWFIFGHRVSKFSNRFVFSFTLCTRTFDTFCVFIIWNEQWIWQSTIIVAILQSTIHNHIGRVGFGNFGAARKLTYQYFSLPILKSYSLSLYLWHDYVWSDCKIDREKSHWNVWINKQKLFSTMFGHQFSGCCWSFCSKT